MINFIYYLLVYGIYTCKTLRFEIKKYNDSIDVSIQSYLGTCLILHDINEKQTAKVKKLSNKRPRKNLGFKILLQVESSNNIFTLDT